MSKYCPNCGEELVDSARFCKNCGASLNEMLNPNTTGNFSPPVVENSHTAAIVIGYILAILIPLGGLIASIYLLTRNSSRAKRHGKYVLILTVVVWTISFLSIFR